MKQQPENRVSRERNPPGDRQLRGEAGPGVSREIEAKFLLADDKEAEVLLRALGRLVDLTADRTIDVTDTYIDSPDLGLFRAGLSCRIRCRIASNVVGNMVDGSGIWTLECKSIAGGGSDLKVREEVQQSLIGETTTGNLPGQGPVIDLLRRHVAGTPVCLVRMVNHRKRYRGQRAGVELEVSLDDVRIFDPHGRCTRSFRELEIERVGGDASALARLVDELRVLAPLRIARLGKFERALWLTGLNTALDRKWLPTDPAEMLLEFQLRHDLRVIAASLEIALEGHDPEGIHRLRTQVRRLRATLAACGRHWGPGPALFARRFKAIADAAGDMRDHDVYAAETMHLLALMPAGRDRTVQQFEVLLDNERVRIREEGFRVLSDPKVLALFDEFRQWIDNTFEALSAAAPSAGRTERSETRISCPRGPAIGELAARELARRTRNVRKGIKRLVARDGRTAGDAALHDLRIRIKKLRYVLELFEPLFGRRMESLLAVLRGLQDRLGRHQDACVAVIRGQQLAAAVPLLPQNRDVLITFGRLQREREYVAAGIRRGFLSPKGRKRLAGELKKTLKNL